MKKVIKKLLIILIVFIIVFEFSFSNTVCAASSDGIDVKVLNSITNLAGGVVSIIFWIPRIIATLLTLAINKTLEAVAGTEGTITANGDGSVFLTPFEIFFNKYKILGINFFNVNEVQSENSFVYKFRKTVAYWFYGMRTIASAILLVVLVYVGIRMALASVAEDKAKYKKMLIDWICSLALIFVLQYLAIAIIYINNSIVEALENVLTNPQNDFNISEMMNGFMTDAIAGVGITSMVSTFVFCAITAQSAFFFIAYLNRMIKIGFLIIISPLISITYSIDKMGDGKAQALNNWLKEFAYTILIQPFHCIIYIALIHTAFTLVEGATTTSVEGIINTIEMNKLANGVLVILCLKFVNDAEKVVRTIFGFSDDNSKTSMAAGAIMAGAAIKNAKNIGSTARKGMNTFKNFSKDLGNAVGVDTSKIANKFNEKFSGVAGKLGGANGSGGLSGAGGAGGLAGKLGNTLGTGQNPNWIGKRIGKARSLRGKYQGSKLQKLTNRARAGLGKQTSRALGLMAMAMTYSTGQTDLLSANAYRKAVQDGSAEFFNSSTNTQANFERENMQAIDDAEYKELGEDIEEAKDEIEKLGFDKNITASEAKDLSESKAASSASEKSKAADEKAKQAQEAYKKAEAAAKQAQEKVAKAEAEKAKANTHRKRVDAQKKIDAAKKELNGKTQAKEDALKHLNRCNDEANDLKEEASKYNKLQALVAKRDKLTESKENFYTQEAKKRRVQQRMGGPSTSDLEKKKNEILKLIMDLERLKRGHGEEDSTHLNLLNEDDTDSVTRTRDNIVKAVDTSVLKGGASIKASDMIMDRTGLDSRAANTLDSIDKAVKEYELLRRKLSVAETFERHASYNGDDDALVNVMVNNLRNSEPEGEEKSGSSRES